MISVLQNNEPKWDRLKQKKMKFAVYFDLLFMGMSSLQITVELWMGLLHVYKSLVSVGYIPVNYYMPITLMWDRITTTSIQCSECEYSLVVILFARGNNRTALQSVIYGGDL
jgi:hypothetical protein